MNKNDEKTVKNQAIQYANNIISGQKLGCRAIRLACARFLNDISEDNELYYYDESEPEKFRYFCSNLKHFTGKFNKQPFELSEYQTFFIANLLGIRRKDNGLRKYTSSYLQIARKNGKSSLIAALSIYFLCAAGEADPSILVVANSLEQSRLNLDMTNKYARTIDPDRKYLINQYSKIKYTSTGVLKIRAADPTRLDGENNSVVIIDEFHQGQKEVLEVLKSGMGSRTEPLLLIITTAGTDLTRHCYSLYTNYKKMLNGEIEMDESTLIMIYELDKEDYDNDSYLTDYILIEKANPNLGISVSKDFIINEINKIKLDYSSRTGVLTKNLNVWLDVASVDNEEKYIDDAVILESMQDLDLEQFRGCWAFAGVDLSSVSDLNCLSLLIPKQGKYYFKNFYYLPSDSSNVKDVKNKMSVWEKEGYIKLTPGNCLDSNYIVEDIKEITEKYNISIIELHLDIYNSLGFQLAMSEKLPSIPLIPFKQSFLNFNLPTKELKINILKGNVVLDKNSVTRWCFHNCVVKVTAQGNEKCMKLNGNHNNKIDGVIASQMSLGGFLTSNYIREDNI